MPLVPFSKQRKLVRFWRIELNVGLGTMSELQRQRDVLNSASEKAKDTISLSMQANAVLNVLIIIRL